MTQPDTPRGLKLLASEIALGAVEGQDPHEFHQDLQVQYMWPIIRASVQSSPKPCRAFHPITLSSYELLAPLMDGCIRAHLPQMHSFQDAWELRARIGQLTECQPHGEEGVLLTEGPNLFYYLEDMVIFVTWRAPSKLFSTPGRWGIESSITEVSPWTVGNRVFSRCAPRST